MTSWYLQLNTVLCLTIFFALNAQLFPHEPRSRHMNVVNVAADDQGTSFHALTNTSPASPPKVLTAKHTQAKTHNRIRGQGSWHQGLVVLTELCA